MYAQIVSFYFKQRFYENIELTDVSDSNHFVIATSENLSLTKQLNVIHSQAFHDNVQMIN